MTHASASSRSLLLRERNHYICRRLVVCGLGAVLLQVQDDGTKKPIAYASRSMTSSEQRYAQIDEEAPENTWACEKFADFVLGKEFLIETDDKPLLPLLGS